MTVRFVLTLLLLGTLPRPDGAAAVERKCLITYDKKNLTLTWTAYKTPYKMPVTGSFRRHEIHAKQSGDSVPEILNGATIEIDGASLTTGNKGRDETIVKAFFMAFTPAKTIKATIENASDYDSVFELNIDMNGFKSMIPMTYMVQRNGLFRATGYLDMLEVGLKKPFLSLHRACAEKKLHDGKTWTDVMITMELPVDIQCWNAAPGEGADQ